MQFWEIAFPKEKTSPPKAWEELHKWQGIPVKVLSQKNGAG
jgi:hypothetical protein